MQRPLPPHLPRPKIRTPPPPPPPPPPHTHTHTHTQGPNGRRCCRTTSGPPAPPAGKPTSSSASAPGSRESTGTSTVRFLLSVFSLCVCVLFFFFFHASGALPPSPAVATTAIHLLLPPPCRPPPGPGFCEVIHGRKRWFLYPKGACQRGFFSQRSAAPAHPPDSLPLTLLDESANMHTRTQGGGAPPVSIPASHPSTGSRPSSRRSWRRRATTGIRRRRCWRGSGAGAWVDGGVGLGGSLFVYVHTYTHTYTYTWMRSGAALPMCCSFQPLACLNTGCRSPATSGQAS